MLPDLRDYVRCFVAFKDLAGSIQEKVAKQYRACLQAANVNCPDQGLTGFVLIHVSHPSMRDSGVRHETARPFSNCQDPGQDTLLNTQWILVRQLIT